jgi:hypothetical protein
MKSSEFYNRKKNLVKYFLNEEKWSINKYGEFEYYKGKRNLRELRFILDLVFGDEMKILSEIYEKDDKGKIIGGSIIGEIYSDGRKTPTPLG